MIEDLGKTMSYQELGCLNEELESFDRVAGPNGFAITTSTTPCPNTDTTIASSALYVYQMILGISTVVYETCFDETNVASVWSRHYNHHGTPKFNDRPEFSSKNLADGAKLEEAYRSDETNVNAWKRVMMSQTGYNFKDKKVAKPNFDFKLWNEEISRGHLTPKGDFDDAQRQVCKFKRNSFYENTCYCYYNFTGFYFPFG